MGRWEPDARGRLQRAALDLYAERGFEVTTAQEIAERAGVTERTFFRYFADKREVLFDGSHLLVEAVVQGVTEADAATAVAMVEQGFAAGTGFFDERREWSVKRSAVIDANPSLQERELLKLSTMNTAVADALRARGVTSSEADLAADLGVALFHRTFRRWVDGDGRARFTVTLHEVYRDFAALTAMAGAVP